MCGITGIARAPGEHVDHDVLRAMTATLVHRGPDGSGTVLPVPHVGLGHRRLSIIDLAGGAQPLARADGRLWITFNGEIFNYRELRAQLEAHGDTFATQSDTEVLLALYEREGEAGFARLRGQYAFAIWDGRGEGRLLLLRDPLGIKPLYWSHTGGVLLFGSEPRALLAHPSAPRRVDEYGLHLYLRYRFVPAPHSAWKGIAKLRPGELLQWQAGRIETRMGPCPVPREFETLDDPEEARAEFEAALYRALERQRIADVPLGSFLSGGIDSGVITALLARGAEGRRVASFTIGFEEKDWDESEFAAETAAFAGTEHRMARMGEEAARAVVPEILAQLDEPFGDPSLVPTWLLCREARREHTVMLSGDGGDELFGGYHRTYRALDVLAWPRALRWAFPVLRRLRRPPLDPRRWQDHDPRAGERYVRLLQDIDDGAAARLYGAALRPLLAHEPVADDPIRSAVRRHASLPPFSQLLMADIDAHLADYHLTKIERASMAHGLEVRVPFLDEDVLACAMRMSASVRIEDGRPKRPLRELAQERGWLPPGALERPKRGFGPPLRRWFRGGLGEEARAWLIGGALVQRGFFDAGALARLLDPKQRKLAGSRIWRLLVLEHWLRRQAD